jgi:inner membrane protein
MSHAVAACALGAVGQPADRLPVRFWIATALLAALPDADVVAFGFGLPYASMLGHRGITHSLAFAAVVGLIVAHVLFRGEGWSRQRLAISVVFFCVIASHGVLDAFTDGGSGVAFFAPFSDVRYHFPWRPIAVSPIGIVQFLSPRGVVVMLNELLLVWLPSAVLTGIAWLLRAQTGRKRPEPES